MTFAPSRLLVATALIVIASARLVRADAFMLPHPDDKSKHVEYFVKHPEGKGPWPTIVLLHGHRDEPPNGGRVFVEWGVLDQFAKRGATAVAVSLPGYGESSGPRDFCGAFTQHAVAGVIAKLRADGLVAPGKLVIEGISRGAVAAGLVAAHDASIAGLVMISAECDLASLGADSAATGVRGEVRKALLDETNHRPAELQERSLIHFAGDIKAATLILNGAKDDRTRPEHSRQLADQITRRGGHARAIIYPDFGHQIPVDARNQDIDPFLASIWK